MRETHGGRLLLFLLLAAAAAGVTQAQPAPPTDTFDYPGTTGFSPSVAIMIIVLVSAFFFLGFFSVYLRQCGGNTLGGGGGGGASLRGALNAMGRSRLQRGLDPAVLETFPSMVYSEVKEHKIGKHSLECAVCLSEFEDDETLRLLPKCSHVFHRECIDEWLASHVTCPVCRCNLALDPNETSNQDTAVAGDGEPGEAEETSLPPAQEAAGRTEGAVVIDLGESEEERRIREEAIELERIGSQRRALRAKSVRRPAKFPRSHSTGHSLQPLAAVRPEESADRFTLRLPDHIRNEIIAGKKLNRTRSLLSFPTGGEACSRQGYRGEGSSRGGRSIRLGRSDRWPSFIVRTFSSRVRRGDMEGSVKKGEGSTKGKSNSIRGPLECIGGGSSMAKVDVAGEEGDDVAIGRRV